MGVGVIEVAKTPPISLRLSINSSAIDFTIAIACEGSAIASSLALKLHKCTLVSLMRDLGSLFNFRFHERSLIANQFLNF